MDNSIAICSDSQAALKALASAKTISQLVFETMKALMELSIHDCVRLLWVQSTVILTAMKKLIKLAKQAANTDYIGPEPVLGLIPSAAKFGSGL